MLKTCIVNEQSKRKGKIEVRNEKNDTRLSIYVYIEEVIRKISKTKKQKNIRASIQR